MIVDGICGNLGISNFDHQFLMQAYTSVDKSRLIWQKIECFFGGGGVFAVCALCGVIHVLQTWPHVADFTGGI